VKLESYKIKWSIYSNNTSRNSSTFFHGFNSIDFAQAAANLPTSSNHAKLITDLSDRIKALEHIASSVNLLKAKIPQIEEQVSMAQSYEQSINQRHSKAK
jgi:hypothetical protein